MSTYWPLPLPDSLGGLVGADDVRNAVKDTIDEWSPYYLAVVSQRLVAQDRLGGAKQIKSPLKDFGKWLNDPDHRSYGSGQPAACLVTVPGTVGVPDKQGNGQIIATWRAQVTVRVFGTDWQEAADLTSWYEKTARWCILQHGSLGGFAMSTKWIGGQYSGREHTSTRTEGVATLGFDVKVGDVIDVNRGPATVPSPAVPPADDSTVETVVVTIDKES